MKSTNKFVIFREEKDEFLYSVIKRKNARMLGWGPRPTAAFNYNSSIEAKQVAQRISNNKGYSLIVCELDESDTQIALKLSAKVSPKLNRVR